MGVVALSKAPIKINRGFTLVELIASILLIGILATYTATKFSSRQGFSEYALRDELISSYRIAQQRAMYDNSPGVCYSLAITGSGFEPQQDGVFFGNLGQVQFAGDYVGLQVTPAAAIYFDGLGNAYTGSCGGTAITSPSYTLTVGGSITAEVYPTGYIGVN